MVKAISRRDLDFSAPILLTEELAGIKDSFNSGFYSSKRIEFKVKREGGFVQASSSDRLLVYRYRNEGPEGDVG